MLMDKISPRRFCPYNEKLKPNRYTWYTCVNYHDFTYYNSPVGSPVLLQQRLS